jgi:hypothetical protein
MSCLKASIPQVDSSLQELVIAIKENAPSLGARCLPPGGWPDYWQSNWLKKNSRSGHSVRRSGQTVRSAVRSWRARGLVIAS